MGTGCARGFLAAFDTAWMVKQWALKRADLEPSGEISAIIWAIIHLKTSNSAFSPLQEGLCLVYT